MLKRLSVGDVIVGMVLGEDIMTRDGVVLLSRGKVLDNKNVEYLKNRTEKTVVIYEKDELGSHETTEGKISSGKKQEAYGLSDIQKTIQNFICEKKDYESTKKIVQSIKNNVSEGFEFLATNHEINDKNFLDLSNQIVSSFNSERQIINPGYIYLMELEKWHPDTFNHSIDVAFFTLFIASQLSQDMGELSSLFLAGLLHDIGKYVYYSKGEDIFYKIITKNGPLTDEEFEIMKKHVDIARFFDAKFRFLTKKERENIVFGAVDHHEKMDGSGYLKGKKGLQISLAGRLVAVSDIYDAMVRKREYKTMMKPDQAMRHVIALGKAGKLDRHFVSIFTFLLGIYPTGSILSTNNGMAMVVGQTDNPSRPRILFLENQNAGEVDLRKKPDVDIYEEITESSGAANDRDV